MPHIPAHQVRTGHFHQLAAAQRTDGLEIFRQNAGDGGFAGAGVAGKDHVHVDLGHLEALGLAALLGLHIFGDVTHIIFHFSQTDDLVQLGLHGIHVTAVLLGQQGQQVKRLAALYAKQQFSIRSGQHGGCAVGGRLLRVQHVLGQGAVGGLAVIPHGLHAGSLAVLGGQQVAHVGPHGQRQTALFAHTLRKPVQLAGGHGGQRLGGKGLGAADVPGQCIHEPRPKGIGQRGLVLVGEKHKIFTAGRQFSDGSGRQRGAHVHQDAPLQHVAAAQRKRPLDGQCRQHI